MLEKYGKPLIEYEGKGKLLYQTPSDIILVDVTFKCIQLQNSHIYIHATPSETTSELILELIVLGGLHPIKTLEGELNDGRKLTIPYELFVLETQSGSRTPCGILLTTFQIEVYKSEDTTKRLHKIRLYLSNLEFIGTEFFNLTERRRARFLPLNIGEFKARILPVADYDERLNLIAASNLCAVTAVLELETTDAQSEVVKNLIEDVCSLLSFARGTLITQVYSEQLDEAGDVFFVIHKTQAMLGYSATRLIDLLPSEDLKVFLETTYPNYIQLREEYQLKQVINTLCHSKHPKTFGELSALHVGTLVDILRARWATKQEREFIFTEKEFKNIRKTIEEKIKEVLQPITHTDKQRSEMKAKANELNRPPFKIVLKEMIAAIKAEISETQVDNFVKSRDSLVHKGRFLSEDVVSEMSSMLYFADRLLMALLGYSGPHLDCRTWEVLPNTEIGKLLNPQ